MPLTPQDVELKQFAKVFRGYDMEEVDEFLDQVEAELSRLLTENQALASRVGEARQGSEPAAVPHAEAAASLPAAVTQPPTSIEPGEPQQAALRTLLMAQRTADQAISEARQEADKVLSEARRRSGQVEAEISARTTAALTELDGRRAELESRIEDLRAFEREYRLRLKAYLETQLKDLGSRGGGSSEELGSGVPAAARTAAVGVLTPGVAQSSAAQPQSLPPQPQPPQPPQPQPPQPAAPASTAPVPAPEEPFVVADEFPQIQPGTPSGSPSGPPVEAGRATAVGPFTAVPPPVPLTKRDPQAAHGGPSDTGAPDEDPPTHEPA